MARYRMKAVSRMLGVRPELLRMWERRYPLFKPQRAGNRYREFDDEDIQLLRYICQQIAAGRSIGELAAEGREALLRHISPPEPVSLVLQPMHALLVDTLVEAACDLDKARLETKLAEGTILYSFATLLTAVVTPLMHRLGELWAAGELSTASEHLVTVLLKQRLLAMLQATASWSAAPVLLCACPPGEWHELGVLTFAYTMQQQGWHICYLGPDLPVQDLVYACQRLQPALVALSLTHVHRLEHGLALLEDIDTRCASCCPTVLGGQALAAYAQVRPRHGLQLLSTLQDAHQVAAGLLSTV